MIELGNIKLTGRSFSIRANRDGDQEITIEGAAINNEDFEKLAEHVIHTLDLPTIEDYDNVMNDADELKKDIAFLEDSVDELENEIRELET